MPKHTIRNGRPDDLATLRDIETSAGAIFADYGMSAIVEDEPLSIEALAQYAEDQRLWVAADESDQPVAYIMVDLIDGCAHIEQVSVHADHAGKQIGQRLIDLVIRRAKEQKLPGVTLTTFSEIPWNAPYYERLGFDVIPEAEHSPGLQRIRLEERAHGLDRWPRVCMKRDITE